MIMLIALLLQIMWALVHIQCMYFDHTSLTEREVKSRALTDLMGRSENSQHDISHPVERSVNKKRLYWD